ncbi:uncharacterized protein BP5553_06051 [Venustampulla echinocandica]|uniref:Cyanovirin-N domain-containing protein n=1 Tax=Venustampulla echinocandica TaxID=2656787 RepID=A0A370TME3_9HELO|nr:uncharacterized protein BP5553_06051 [Venustampulla echinocandica]RDL36699.1 hypothetical protein BP5553_06051 [Venustampulla echinocandica]
MHFLKTISILAAGLVAVATASPLAQRDNPNDGSYCESFSVGRGTNAFHRLNGFFGALCSGPGRERHPTDVKLDQFITLGSDSKMYWKYLPQGTTFTGYCSDCSIGGDWNLKCRCSTSGWMAANQVESTINIYRKSWDGPGVWYNKDQGELNVAAP